MIILLDTSTPTAQMTVVLEGEETVYEWEAGRELAKGLIGWIESSLHEQQRAIGDISGIGVYAGPGSFTGLRIGITVANTLADSLGVAIVATTGGDWRNECLGRLRSGANDRIALPLYDREANITKPRK